MKAFNRKKLMMLIQANKLLVKCNDIETTFSTLDWLNAKLIESKSVNPQPVENGSVYFDKSDFIGAGRAYLIDDELIVLYIGTMSFSFKARYHKESNLKLLSKTISKFNQQHSRLTSQAINIADTLFNYRIKNISLVIQEDRLQWFGALHHPISQGEALQELYKTCHQAFFVICSILNVSPTDVIELHR